MVNTTIAENIIKIFYLVGYHDRFDHREAKCVSTDLFQVFAELQIAFDAEVKGMGPDLNNTVGNDEPLFYPAVLKGFFADFFQCVRQSELVQIPIMIKGFFADLGDSISAEL